MSTFVVRMRGSPAVFGKERDQHVADIAILIGWTLLSASIVAIPVITLSIAVLLRPVRRQISKELASGGLIGLIPSELVDGDLQVTTAVHLGLGKRAAAQIDLKGVQHTVRQAERGVALFARGDEVRFRRSLLHVPIRG